MWQLNINSLRNKVEYITEIIRGRVDIFMVSETKLDSSFLHSQFHIQNYSTFYRLDRTENIRIIIYIKEEIQSKLLKLFTNIDNKECLFIEINLGIRKWLLICGHNPHKGLISSY